MGVLGAIVEIAVLPMFHTRQELSLGGSITLQLIREMTRGAYWHPL
jgi:hypothetical protein